MFNYRNDKPEFYPIANVIADSLNVATNDRLTTMVCTYHRFIHSEVLTHRKFSRNSSSSRAIPVTKMIDKVLADNVYPLHFGKNKKGMQASEEIAEIETAKKYWDWSREDAVHRARLMIELNVHKQVVNRLLEPFSTITVIISSTEWTNFFKQRCHPDAQPEIQALANQMQKVLDSSVPKDLNPGKWHIPFIQDNDTFLAIQGQLKLSVGRCARVSYLNHDGVRNIQDDLDLHEKLINSDPKHLSPFEHQAIATAFSEDFANFKGFQQYRNILETKRNLENISDHYQNLYKCSKMANA